jgi:hypothetical protein
MIDQKLKPRERLDCLLIYHGKDLDIDRYITSEDGMFGRKKNPPVVASR